MRFPQAKLGVSKKRKTTASPLAANLPDNNKQKNMTPKKETKVILVDDDMMLGTLISNGLTELGYNVHYQSTLLSLENLIRDFSPNIIFLDVEVGDKDSIEESAHFAKLFPSLPIVFISSHAEGSYQKRALIAGGVCYLKKPIKVDELEVYIEKYSRQYSDDKIAVGNIVLDIDAREFFNISTKKNNRLNAKDTLLLKLLMLNADKVVHRAYIEAEVWKEATPSEHVLNNCISRLRKVLADESGVSISTIHNIGYKLKTPASNF